jgi:hypothetical protein
MTVSHAYITADDYMDADVAYLLGMLFGRGQLIEAGDVRRAVITLDIRRKLPKLPPGKSVSMDLELENERALNAARRRINELLDANVDIAPIREGQTTLSAVFVKQTIAWRDLKILCSNGVDRSNFLLPSVFFEFGQEIHKEFLRGFADVAVMPSWADNAYGRTARIAFPVVHANKRFANQLVKLLKNVKASPQLLPGTAAKRGSKKEHRIRLSADDYEPVGFCFQHKQTLLKVLADYNREE